MKDIINYCSKCGKTIIHEADFCNQCGYRFNQRKNKPILLVVTILALLLVSALGVSFVINNTISYEGSKNKKSDSADMKSNNDSPDVELEEYEDIVEIKYLPLVSYTIDGTDVDNVKKTAYYTYDDEYNLVESGSYDGNENIISKTINKYDKNGNVIEERDEYSNGDVSVAYTEYDSLGRIIKYIIGDKDNPRNVSTYEYDDNDNLIGHYCTGEDFDSTIYEYDDQGRQIRSTTLSRKDNSHVSSRIYEYDMDNVITKITYLDKNDKISSWTEYIYSDNIKTENDYDSAGNLKYSYKTRTNYDEYGREISTETSSDTDVYWKLVSSTVYNDDTTRDYIIFDDAYVSRFEKYDENDRKILEACYNVNTFDGYTECDFGGYKEFIPIGDTSNIGSKNLAECMYTGDGKIQKQFFTKYLKVMTYSDGTVKTTEIEPPEFSFFVEKKKSDRIISIEASVDEGLDYYAEGICDNDEILSYCSWSQGDNYDAKNAEAFVCKQTNKGVDIKIYKNGVYRLNIEDIEFGHGKRKNEVVINTEGGKRHITDDNTIFLFRGGTGKGSLRILIVNGEIFPAQ